MSGGTASMFKTQDALRTKSAMIKKSLGTWILLAGFAASFGAQGSSYAIGAGNLVDPANADAWYCAQPGGCTASGTRDLWATNYPKEIGALAAALDNDVDLIYEYVRNNIEIVPMYGLQKGALGSLIDRSGTAFDQAHLMVELLRAAGYSAAYVTGTITLTGNQAYSWLGVSDAVALRAVLGDGGIPATVSPASGAVSSVTLSHVWVRATIAGKDHVFDPSFKPHTFVAGIDIAAATGFSEASFLATAQSGMSSGTHAVPSSPGVAGTFNLPYVTGPNAAGIKSRLTSYANTLVTYLRSNGYATQRIEDVVGRQDIQPASEVVRQTSLPSASVQRVWTGNIPDVYRTRVRLEMIDDSGGLSQDLFADEIYGRRVAYYPYATGNGWLVDTTRLRVDGIDVGALYSGPDTAVTQAGSRLRTVRITVNHPYADASGAYMDTVVSKLADFISPVIVITGFGDTSESLQAKLASEQMKDKLLPHSSYWRCGPGGEGCENPERPAQPAGETALVQTYAGWLANLTRMTRMQTRLRNSVYQQHNVVGVAYRRSFLTVTNPNGPCGNCWAVGQAAMVLDASTALSLNSKTASGSDRKTLARSLSMAAHTLEASQWEQQSSSATPASVGHRFGWAAANDPSMRYYLIQPGANSASLFPQGLTPYFNASIHPAVHAYTSIGQRVIVAGNQFLGPGRACTSEPCTSTQNVVYLERGGALQAFAPDGLSVSSIVTDGFGRRIQGGAVGDPPNHEEAYTADKSKDLLRDQFKDRSKEFGVDLSSGEFTYAAREDLSVGLGEFPYRLAFQRTFKSGEEHSPGMGKGWTHNHDMRLSMSTNVVEAMGRSSTLAAASTLVALYATQKIYEVEPATDAALLSRYVVAPFVHDWWAEKIRFNVVAHSAGGSTKTFVRLADGSFNPPGGYDPKDGTSQWRLVQTGSPTGYGERWEFSGISFTLTSPGKDVQTFAYWRRRMRDFNLPHDVGRHHGWHITKWSFPTGVSVSYGYVPVDDSTYVADQLAFVQNSLGRRINLKFAAASDWARCVFQSVDDSVGARATYDCTTATMTSPTGDIAKYVYGALNCWGSADRSVRPRCSPYLTEVFGASDASLPKIRLTYDPVGIVRTYADAVAVKQPTGRNPYTFNIAGTRGERVDPAGKRYTVYYDQYQQPIQFIDELGNASNAAYDGLGRVIRRTSAAGIVTEFEYDPRGNATLLRQLPRATVPITTPGRISIVATYDAACNGIKTVRDGNNNVTTWNYDPVTCQVRNIQQPLVRDGRTGANAIPTTSYTYTPVGLIDTIADPTGVVTDYGYDSLGNRRSQTIDPAGISATMTYGYDGVGNITSVTTGRGKTTTYSYDRSRRVTSITGPAATCAITRNTWVNGVVEQVRQARVCNPNDVVDADWQIWRKTYTPTDLIDVETDPDGGTIDTDYDPLDRAEYVRQSVGGGRPERVTRAEYDATGQVTRIFRAWGTDEQITYAMNTYDADGRLTSVADANGNLTSHMHDGFGRLHRSTFPDASYEQLKYDANGNIVAKRNRSGFTISSAFDALNREIGRTVPDNSTYPGSFARATSTTYDLASRKWDVTADGQTLGHRYDTAGRLERVIDSQLNALGGSAGNVEYAYDASGNRKAVTFYSAAGPWTAEYFYDDGERLWQIKAGSSVLAQYAYDPLQRIDTVNYLDATSVGYGYEPDDDLRSLTHSYKGGSLTLVYGHNGAHQINSLSVTDSSFLMKQAPPPTSYTPNNLNQYSQVGAATMTYDPNGNLLGDGAWEYRYDEESRLRRALRSGVDAEYSYDARGRRRSKKVNGTTTYFIYDGQNELAELSASGARLRLYVNAQGLDDRVAMHEDAAGTGWHFYHRNHQNSVLFTTRLTTSGGIGHTHRYDAYGNEYSTDPATGNAFRYTGRYLDAETGLYYYRARYYSNALGRFLQSDSIGYKDDLNLYSYSRNDPLNFIDPDGREVAAIYANDSQTLLMFDKDTRQAAFVAAESGGKPFGDPVPPGYYAILERAGRAGFYRLERLDSDFGNDETPEGRTNLRLHHPGRTIGCIAVCKDADFRRVEAVLGNTKKSESEVDSKSLIGRLTGKQETVTKFGMLRVLPAGATLSMDAKTGAVTISTTPTGSHIARKQRICTMKNGVCE